MPEAVAIAVAADTAATLVADAIIFDFVAATTFDWVASYAVIQAGSSFLIGSALRGALSGGGEMAPQQFAQQTAARTHIVRSAVANRQIIYGEAMVSGPLLWVSTASSNQWLLLVVALAGHECESVEAIYFNDEEVGARDGNGDVTTGPYANNTRIVVHLGSADQEADEGMVSTGLGWTEEHRLSGVCYLAIHLLWDADAFPRGIPNIKARVRGKKLYDPRSGLTAWSDNWALACRDYLTSSDGLRCTDAELDDVAIMAAANIADEAVTLADDATEARYTVNAAFDLGMTPRAIMEALLSGGAGTLTWPGGVYTLHAGAYDAPTLDIDADMLRGGLAVRAKPPKQELYNAVRGTFIDPAQNWQPVDFPPATNATYEVQDGGLRLFRDMAFPVTNSSARAQRLAKIALEKSRQGISVTAPCTLAAFKAQIWDVVTLTISHLGWTDKEFRVVGWSFSETGGIDLALQEESASCYAWSAEETVIDPAPDTHLPDPFTVAAPGTPEVAEIQYQTTGSAGVKSRARASWGASTSSTVVGYEPALKLAADSEWTQLSLVTDLFVDVYDLAPGSYDFRVRALSTLGVRSDWSATRTAEILGLTAPPSDVSGLTVVPRAGMAHADWTLTSDLDVRIGGSIVIRHSSKTSGAAWEDGIVLREFPGGAVGGTLPLLSGTYMAKAQDSSGNWSTGIASFYASEDLVTGWTVVSTVTEHTAFGGAKTNVAVVGGALQLDSASLIDAMATSIDSWDSVDAIGGIQPTGSYAFTSTLDMTTVATRNFIVSITASSFDTGDLIDSRTTEIDYWDSIDGGVVNDCDVTPYIRTTQDDPSGSPVWGAWVPFYNIDMNCRAAQFRLDFQSGNRSHNISVSALTVRARIPA